VVPPPGLVAAEPPEVTGWLVLVVDEVVLVAADGFFWGFI